MHTPSQAMSIALFLALILAGLPSAAFAECGSRTFSVNENQVVDAYIAYYGRPADAGGLTYWADRLRREGRLTSIIDSFGDSQEFTSRYGGLGSEQLVRNLYLQLFGRQPDGPGLDYWIDEFESGRKSLQSISLDILAGARNTDQQIIQNRNQVARHYLTLAEQYPNTRFATESLLSNVYSSSEGAASACGYISALFGAPSSGGGSDYLAYSVGGEASGLQGVAGLKLESGNQTENLSLRTNGSFTFQQKLHTSDFYSVSVSSPPSGQTCHLSNGFGEITNHDQTTLKLVCAANSGKYSISGTIESAAAIDYDSDLNDPLSPSQSNDDFPEAQPIDNRITLHGFASATGTWAFSDQDRFAYYGDEYDVFKTTLQKGQHIQMQIIDYDQFEVGGKYEGDLDLYIFDTNMNIVDGSESDGEYESLVVPKDGEYYVAVVAYSGISKYVLQLLPAETGASASTRITANLSMDFIPNQMVLERKALPFSFPLSAADSTSPLPVMTFAHEEIGRATLGKIDRETQHQKQMAAASLQGKSAPLSALKKSNPESWDKLMTLIDIKHTRKAQGVALAEPDYRIHPLNTPNDKHYGLQWHYPQIQLPQAWDLSTGQTGEPVIVAVVDTGVFLNHPDMKSKLVAGYDFISNPEMARDGDGIDANPDDPGDSLERGQSSWHGTHVAGTIAAATNDQYGVAGVSWGAKIMPVRGLGVGGGSSYDLVQAVRYASGLSNDSGTVPARRADVINMSYGGGSPSTFAQKAFAEARAAGVILVASAGNENTDAPSFPASYPGVISVSATGFSRTLAPYSNFGQTVDVAAPGGDTSVDASGDQYPDGVLSLSVDDTSGTREPVFRFMAGTSMASPHMAGVVALMKSVYPGLTPDQLDTLLQNGEITDDLGSRGWDSQFGHGLINAYKAVLAAQNLAKGGATPVEPSPRLSVAPTSVAMGQGAVATFTLGNQGSGSLKITGLAPSVPWLSVSAVQTDANGLGSYQIKANRSALSVGNHAGSITVSSSSGSPYRLSVTLQVGALKTEGRVTQQYVLLLDANTLDYVTGALSTEQNGNQAYLIENVPVGQYFLFSSSDIDHDYMPCVSGEVCGAYPSLQSKSVLEVLDKPLTNVNLVVDMLSGLTDRSEAFWVEAGVQLPPTKKARSKPVPKESDIGEGEPLQAGNHKLWLVR